jgi:GTP-binding protein Era
MTTSSKNFSSATVAILGRPNAGKSTLLNALLDVELSAVSNRPQTTRSNLRGVMQFDDTQGQWAGQLVLVDTPGLNFARGLLERSMRIATDEALEGVDVAVWIADARTFAEDLRDIEMDRPGSDKIAGWLKENIAASSERGTQWVIVLSKVDQVAKPELLPLMERVAAAFPMVQDVVPVASMKGLGDSDSNLDSLIRVLRAKAPQKEPAFPRDALTDQSEKDLLRNLVREAVFRQSRQEVPYETDCSVVQWIEAGVEGRRRPEADVTIWVTRDSLKAILVGKGGTRIRDIGIHARTRYQQVTGEDLILRLQVKVVDQWLERPELVRELGYSIEK